VRLAEVAIPERMADAVAAFDLNYRTMAAAVLALTPGCVVDATGAEGSGLAVLAVSPQVRAEVVHRRIISCGPLRIKSGSTSLSPLNGSVHGRFAGSR
jgi:hypothetical protein